MIKEWKLVNTIAVHSKKAMAGFGKQAGKNINCSFVHCDKTFRLELERSKKDRKRARAIKGIFLSLNEFMYFVIQSSVSLYHSCVIE